MPCRWSVGSHSRSTCQAVSLESNLKSLPGTVCARAILEDDVQTVLGLDKADVFDDIVVVEVLEEVDLGLLSHRQQSLLLMSP